MFVIYYFIQFTYLTNYLAYIFRVINLPREYTDEN